uniref:ArsA-type ATPase efflux pump protein n=1 Tax=uncultured bacterium CSL144 TaxID=1091570 RepID=G4WVQ9_9BACT|nr:ArsA-type ATPase efflux pump protein [uncultured bacterium CSL144]
MLSAILSIGYGTSASYPGNGKGGTGKTSVACALALALSNRGKTVLADLDQRWTAARLLGVDLDGPSDFAAMANLEVRSFTPRTELEAFIERIVPIKVISRRMLRSHTFGYVTAALPGLQAFLMLERLRQLADEAAARNGFAVIDAPASGSLLELLSVGQGVGDLAPSGTLNRLARAVDEFLRDPRRFGVLLVARPERLAVREALEVLATLRDELRLGYVVAILNGVPDPLLSSSDFAKMHRLAAHRRLALQRRATSELAVRAHKRFEDSGVEVIELPMLYTSEFARPQIEILATALDRLAYKQE